MGVYIKGMDMPMDCSGCALALFPMCLLTRNHVEYRARREDCPLIEVPTSHGRLIDERIVMEIAMEYCTDDDGTCSKAGTDLREMLDDIENAPTVVESEG